MLVCGDKEVESRSVAPRAREKGTQLAVMPLDSFADFLAEAAAIPRPPSPQQ
jgi:threonyl-tRNA synthetase